MGRSAPRPAAAAIRTARDRAAPQTPLAMTQAVWEEVVGPAVAAAAEPVSERRGAVTVRCESAVWAQELEMMGTELLGRLRDRLGPSAPISLRFDTATGWPANQ